jgi:hypothetical protein
MFYVVFLLLFLNQNKSSLSSIGAKSLILPLIINWKEKQPSTSLKGID